MIGDYLAMAGHADDLDGPLFRPVKNNRGGGLNKALSPHAVYNNIVLHYGKIAGVGFPGFRTHAMRFTAATNALDRIASAIVRESGDWR